MKKLYKAIIELDTYFIADDVDDIKAEAIDYIADDFNIREAASNGDYLSLNISEISSSSEISDRWKNGKYLVWGIKEELTPQEWLLKAFL